MLSLRKVCLYLWKTRLFLRPLFHCKGTKAWALSSAWKTDQSDFKDWECLSYHLQKEPFTDVLQNRCFEKFRKFHRKTPVLESHYNKVAGHRCYPVRFAKFLRKAFFYRTPLVAASSFNVMEGISPNSKAISPNCLKPFISMRTLRRQWFRYKCFNIANYIAILWWK